MTNHPEHLSLQQNYSSVEEGLPGKTSNRCCWDQLFVYYWQANPCHVVLVDKALLYSCSEPVGNRALQIIWGVIYWFRPGAVFLQRAKWIHAASCGRDILRFGYINYFKGVSILNCHPNTTFGLGMQRGSCWSQQYYLNIKSVGKLLCYVQLTEDQIEW